MNDQSHSGGTVFGRKKEPTVGDYVEAVRGQAGVALGKGRDRGADLAEVYGPIARQRALEAYAWSRPRLDPYVEKARLRAQPYVDRAIVAAAPRMQRVVNGLEPRVDKAHDVIVQSWIPHLSAGIAALAGATAAAKSQVVDISGRAPDAVAVLKGDKVAKEPRGGKVLLGLGVVAAVGAVVVVLANRKPKEDPWATPTTSYTPPAKTFTDRVSGAKETVTQAAGTAAHKVSDAAGAAAHKASEAADKAKSAATDRAKAGADKGSTAASDATSSEGESAKATTADTVDVLGDVADTKADTPEGVGANLAGAASDVKPDVTEAVSDVKPDVTQGAADVKADVTDSAADIKPEVTKRASRARPQVDDKTT
jgi:hypothetical protein